MITPRQRKALREAAGLFRNPLRGAGLPLVIIGDKLRDWVDDPHLYRYISTRVATPDALAAMIGWLQRAQRPDGGVAGYYSLLSGYSQSYPETTGYIIPTFYDCAALTNQPGLRQSAARMTEWLLTLQSADGSFPGGYVGEQGPPSIFNSGQILQGLVRAWEETHDARVLEAAKRCGDWLVRQQRPSGEWIGYQGQAHTYYTMVAWSLAYLAKATGNARYADTARRNADWTIASQANNGWFDNVNLQGHPTYLHFVAYIIQGLVETGNLLDHQPAIDSAARAAWKLLKTFEVKKTLPGAFADREWRPSGDFECLTGFAQMSCSWWRLFAITRDLRYANAALKINEALKERLRLRGRSGVRGGVAGSFPHTGAYQAMRYINWGAKFAADALMWEVRAMTELNA